MRRIRKGDKVRLEKDPYRGPFTVGKLYTVVEVQNGLNPGDDPEGVYLQVDGGTTHKRNDSRDGTLFFFLEEVTRVDGPLSTIAEMRGRIFGVDVQTRSGKIRRMNVKTTPDSYAEANLRNNQVVVLENNLTHRNGVPSYRTIALEGVREIRGNGQRYIF